MDTWRSKHAVVNSIRLLESLVHHAVPVSPVQYQVSCNTYTSLVYRKLYNIIVTSNFIKYSYLQLRD